MIELIYNYIFEKENFIISCREKRIFLYGLVVLIFSVLNFSISNMLVYDYHSGSSLLGIVFMLLSILLYLLVLAIFTAILHFVSVLLKGEATTNVLSFFSYVCFSFLPSFILLPSAIVLSILPEGNILRAAIYNIIYLAVCLSIMLSQVKGIKVFYNISTRKSLIIYFSPIIVFFILLTILIGVSLTYIGLKISDFLSMFSQELWK